jgi:hypothetical protein
LPAHKAPSKDHLKEVLKTALKEGRTLLNEEESKDFLVTYGIPVTPAQLAQDPEAAVNIAEKMVTTVDYELILRAKKDRYFCSVILFGMGGTNAEFIKDFSIGLPPLNQTLAKILMQDTKVYKMLQGFRDKPAADFEGLEKSLSIFQSGRRLSEIAEIDINPLPYRMVKPPPLTHESLLTRIMTLPGDRHILT